MTPRRLAIAFSGGETSAFMVYHILNGSIKFAEPYDEILVRFANTGQENEETLEFVNLCDWMFGFGTVWIEAVTHPGERRSPSARIVTFETASRNGEPFEAAIQKYGIPNSKFKNCTRNLKTRPMDDHSRSIGWGMGTFDTAIGIRVDEIDRVSVNAKKERLIYPLVSLMPTTKKQVNEFWRRQPFRLRLKGYQGNCKWCWKKSMRKHFTLMKERPEIYDFPARMEEQYGMIGPEFAKPDTPPGYRRVFFRENKSVNDVREEFIKVKDTFLPAPDDADVYPDFDPALDVGGGCEESCEVFSDEDAGDDDE